MPSRNAVDSRPSVATLVRGRQAHLNKLIDGLQHQTLRPAELVIANMQSVPPSIPENAGFPIRLVTVEGDRLPLAAARNRAADLTRSMHLVFLDVDCIPGPDLVQSYNTALDRRDGCMMGEVRYLPALADMPARSFSNLLPHAERHPARPAAPDTGWRDEPDPGSLWGLSFALRRTTFESVGGFDERYIGYGAEETDFARRLHSADVPLAWCGNALALHQQHAVYAPPLTHFDDILRNTQVFHDNWGVWCMEYWLEQFDRQRLINWSADARRIELLRRPTEKEIEDARRPPSALWG